MTEKDAVLEKIELVKLIIGVIIGSMFAVSTYNLQTGGSIGVIAIVSLIMSGIALFIIIVPYNKLVEKLKELP